MKTLLALLLLTSNAYAHRQQDEIVLLGYNEPLSWFGDIVKFKNNGYVMCTDHYGDEIFIDAFQPMEIATWSIVSYLGTDQWGIGDIDCGRWTQPHLVVINCAVKP